MTASPAELTSGQLEQLGSRLRRLRADRGWTLADVAQRTGLSRPYLSRLEGGDRQPSLAALLALAAGHGMALASLLETALSKHDSVVVRGGAAPKRSGNGLTYRLLSPKGGVGGMEAIGITVPAGRAETAKYEHAGQEWLYVLAGRLRLVIGDEELSLRRGDAAQFDARFPHRLIAEGGDCELLLVACPVADTLLASYVGGADLIT